MKSWADTQQKLLTNWLNTVRGVGNAPTLELWTQTVDAWQTSVKETLDAQAQWINQWTEALANAKGTPEEMRQLARQASEQMQRWVEAERDLWQGWFKIVREINFKPELGTGTQTGMDLVKLWQDSAHSMIDTQAELVRRWTGSITGSSKES